MSDGNPVRLLIVDDDEMSREVLAVLLEAEGYTVDSAEDGAAALHGLQSGRFRPEAVLSDLQMPGIAGNELARALRAAAPEETPILAMSGTDPRQGDVADFDGFLRKPFTAAELAGELGKRSASELRAGGEKEAESPAGLLDERVYGNFAGMMPPEKLKELYEMCLRDARSHAEGMRAAAAAGDDVLYRQRAHAMKGSLGMVGATRLHGMAAAMESAGISGDHIASPEEFMHAVDDLQSMLVARGYKPK